MIPTMPASPNYFLVMIIVMIVVMVIANSRRRRMMVVMMTMRASCQTQHRDTRQQHRRDRTLLDGSHAHFS
jgi:hypothetical protein